MQAIRATPTHTLVRMCRQEAITTSSAASTQFTPETAQSALPATDVPEAIRRPRRHHQGQIAKRSTGLQLHRMHDRQSACVNGATPANGKHSGVATNTRSNAVVPCGAFIATSAIKASATMRRECDVRIDGSSNTLTDPCVPADISSSGV